MMIVDAQIHLWAKGTPSAHHRQEPYSKDQALAGMDAAGVDRAVIHPVMWDPDSNELAVEAVRAHPDRFAILGWFYLDRPESRALIDTWKNRPGMLGLRFYFNEPRMQTWPTDGTLDWLWPAAERAGLPVALAAAAFLPVVGQIAETDRRPHGGAACLHGRGGVSEPAAIARAGEASECRGQGDRPGWLCRGRLSIPQHSSASARGL
jgi:predicted TIM-barrel fold metal-dependent hydrolase